MPNPPGFKKSAEPKAETKRTSGFWPFKRKESNLNGKSGYSEPKFPPKDPPPSPFPLLRLSFPLTADTGTIQPGIYLVKPLQSLPNPEAAESGSKIYVLTRQNKVVLNLAVHPVIVPDQNMKLTGTPSPLTKASPKALPALKAETRLSDDQKTLTFVIKDGEHRFESAPFPVAVDQRRLLTF